MHSILSKIMEDLQEETQKLVDDGGGIDENQANMAKVAACLLAANVVKQVRNKRLRNNRRKTAPHSHTISVFLCPLAACPVLDKKLETMEMSQLTAFEYYELLSHDLFANELRLNSDQTAILQSN